MKKVAVIFVLLMTLILITVTVGCDQQKTTVPAKTTTLVSVVSPIVFALGNPLPDGMVGDPYKYSIADEAAISGGHPPYSFTLGPGVGFPPMGIIMDTNGILSGTPSAEGKAEFEVVIKDLDGNHVAVITHIIIQPAPDSPTPPVNIPPASTPPIITPTPSSTPVILSVSGTFIVTVDNGGWSGSGFGDQRTANATATIPFHLGLKPRYVGGTFTGQADVNVTWTGDWGARSTLPTTREQSGTVTGTGTVTITGEYDPKNPGQVSISLDAYSFAQHTVTLQPEPKKGEPGDNFEFFMSHDNLLFAAVFDAYYQGFSKIFKTAGDSLTYSASREQFGTMARMYFSTTGSYTFSVTIDWSTLMASSNGD